MKFEEYPIRYGTKIRGKDGKPDRYRFDIYCSKMEAQAVNYFLSHRVGAPIKGERRKATITDVFLCMSQEWMGTKDYWTPFYNIEKKLLKKKERTLKKDKPKINKEELDQFNNE